MNFSNTRQAMAWLHTWLGLFAGFVLMVCFFFGSLSVFDREIDRWAIPETRFDPQPMPSYDQLLSDIFARAIADQDEYDQLMPVYHNPQAGEMTPREALPADEYWAYTTHRDPVLSMGVGFKVPHPRDENGHNHIHANLTIDPRNGKLVSSDTLKIGSDWFYPLHYSLNLQWNYIGYYIVGIAAFFMLVALVSGVWIHRKIFREFFTFRPQKRLQRKTLDLHNMTGVVALPFHFFFALTGLMIFAAYYYLPITETTLKPLHELHEELEARATGLPHKRSGQTAELASVDAMMAAAKARWAERGMPGEVGFFIISHVGDANSYVSIYRAGSDRVALVGEPIHFSGTSGEILYEELNKSAAEHTGEFLAGLHLQHFEHWFLRWLYLLAGLLGCVCIATGFIFFTEKRKAQHAREKSQGSRIVDAFATATVTGMMIASVCILLANRLLPSGLDDKGSTEKLIFCLIWLATLLHALARNNAINAARLSPAWAEQCAFLAVLSLMTVTANWLTTGDHLLKTLWQEPYMAVAGVDLVLIVTALISALAARRLFTAHHVQPLSRQECACE